MASAGIGASLEGFHAVRAALDAGRVTSIRVETSRVRRDDYRQLVYDATVAGVTVHRVKDVRRRGHRSAARDHRQGSPYTDRVDE